MKPLSIHVLYFALVAVYFDISGTAAEPQYGGFSSHPDSLQVFYDYIHGQEMMKVEAGPELRSTVEAIPVDLAAPIDLEQETGLRDWLYDFLVAFSASGSDSLAAAFYLREGVNNPDMIEVLKKYLDRRDTLTGDYALCHFCSRT